MDKPELSPTVIAFIQGAKWWEFVSTGGTMWESDQEAAAKEALHRESTGSLGKRHKITGFI